MRIIDIFSKEKCHKGIEISAATAIGSYSENCDVYLIGDKAVASKENDDYHECLNDDREVHYVAVFDGMNGEPRAREAALCAAQAIIESPPKDISDGKRVLVHAGERVEQEFPGSGTTLSLLIWQNDTYSVINAGDSPIYLLRKGILKQISEDHSLAGQKKLQGIEPFARDASYLMKYLGCGVRDIEWNITKGKLQAGDLFLLCSDGITKAFSDEKIRKFLKKRKKQTVTEMIVSGAAKRKNSDNCTAILLSVGTIEGEKEQENQLAEKEAAEEVENTTSGKAIEWCVKAAEGENAKAQNHLGACYATGRGVVQSEEKESPVIQDTTKRSE